MGVLYNHASFATKIIHSRYNMPRIQYNFLFLLCFTNSNITLLPSRIYQKSFFYFNAKNFIVKMHLKMIFMLKEQDSTLTRTALFFCSSVLLFSILLYFSLRENNLIHEEEYHHRHSSVQHGCSDIVKPSRYKHSGNCNPDTID